MNYLRTPDDQLDQQLDREKEGERASNSTLKTVRLIDWLGAL